ncbi:hypothetical protein L914_04506, partial [Phytophthora nicotianae]
DKPLDDFDSGKDELSDDELLFELPIDRGGAVLPQPLHAPVAPRSTPTSRTIAANEYLASLQTDSDLHLSMESRVKNAIEKDGPYGLFGLFATVTLSQSIRPWTSTKL